MRAIRCRACGAEFEPRDHSATCPKCGFWGVYPPPPARIIPFPVCVLLAAIITFLLYLLFSAVGSPRVPPPDNWWWMY